MGAGVDWALVPELPAHVTVTRAPGIFGPWMAEYILAWALRVTQRMATYLEAHRERRWVGHVLPERIEGKTLAIVGLAAYCTPETLRLQLNQSRCCRSPIRIMIRTPSTYRTV